MELIKNETSCSVDVIDKYNKLVKLYGNNSSYSILELILTRYFDDNDFESLTDLMMDDLMFGDYTWEIQQLAGNNGDIILIRPTDISKDIPENTYDSVPQIMEQLLDEGYDKDKIYKSVGL